MMLHELITEFLRENGLKITGRFLNQGPKNLKPKLIRFVKGSYKYSIVFVNEGPVLHLFKEKLNAKRPYNRINTIAGLKNNRGYQRSKIKIDFNDQNSFKQIINFL